MTTQFQAGQTYTVNSVEYITVTRRSDVSVWFSRNGKEVRRKIQVSGYGENTQEFVNYEDRSLYAVKLQASVTEVIEAETIEPQVSAKVEPQTTDSDIETNDIAGWEYINSRASYENRSNENYSTFSKLSTAAYNGEFEGVYFEKIYNWIDQMTATAIDTFVAEFKDLDSAKHYVVFADHAMKLYQSREIEPDTIIPSVNLNTLDSDTTEILETLEFPQDDILETLEFPRDEILETLEFPRDEILETLEFPQGSAQDLDLFEVTYQVLDCDDVSYESRKVYAYNHEHAKAIVSQDLQAQHLRFCITGCEYALVIDDLSEFVCQ